ncbi:hypothetical protein Tco_1433111, partial [Tanacetum coccineum]
MLTDGGNAVRVDAGRRPLISILKNGSNKAFKADIAGGLAVVAKPEVFVTLLTLLPFLLLTLLLLMILRRMGNLLFLSLMTGIFVFVYDNPSILGNMSPFTTFTRKISGPSNVYLKVVNGHLLKLGEAEQAAVERSTAQFRPQALEVARVRLEKVCVTARERLERKSSGP